MHPTCESESILEQKLFERKDFACEYMENGERRRKILRFHESWIVPGQKMALLGILKYIISPVHDLDENGFAPKTFCLAPVRAAL